MALKELARLFVRIRAPREQLRSDLEGAKQDVQQFGAETEGTAQKVNASLGGVGDKIKDSTKGVRGFISSITGVIGAFTRVLGIVGLIAGAVTGLIALVSSLGEKSEAVAEAERKAAEHAERRATILRKIEGQAEGKPEKSEADTEADALRKQIQERSHRIAKLKSEIKEIEANSASAEQRLIERGNSVTTGSTQARIERMREMVRGRQEELKTLTDQTKIDLDTIQRLGIAGGKIERKKADEELHKARMKQIEIEEAHRLQLQINNLQQLNALQQSAAQFNNSFAYDIRRLVSSVEQIKGRLN